MKLKLFLILTFLGFSLDISAQRKEFVGYKHKGVVYGQTLPNGAKDLGGSLLSDEDYGVSRFSKGGKNYLWLEKITGHDREGVPSWIVKDVLEFDGLKNNQEFLFGLSSICTQNGRKNQDLIVLAEFAKNKKSFRVLKAWRANVRQERFEETSAKGIKCRYDGR